MITFYCLRHGEPEKTGLLLGSTDLALSPKGWSQLESCYQKNISTSPIQHIYTSPLQRCSAFAKHLSESENIPLTTIDDLQEIHFGDWDGQDVHELWQKFPEPMENFFKDPWSYSLPGQEPLATFVQRIKTSIQAISHQHPNGHILLMTHGGVIKTLLYLSHNQGSVEKSNYFQTIKVDYASLSTITTDF